MIETVQCSGGLVSLRALPGGGESVYELNTAYFSALARTFEGEAERQIVV